MLSRDALAEHVLALDERIAPLAFRKALVKRLGREKGLSENECSLPAHKALMGKRRDMILRVLFWELYQLLRDDAVIVRMPFWLHLFDIKKTHAQ